MTDGARFLYSAWDNCDANMYVLHFSLWSSVDSFPRPASGEALDVHTHSITSTCALYTLYGLANDDFFGLRASTLRGITKLLLGSLNRLTHAVALLIISIRRGRTWTKHEENWRRCVRQDVAAFQLSFTLSITTLRTSPPSASLSAIANQSLVFCCRSYLLVCTPGSPCDPPYLSGCLPARTRPRRSIDHTQN